MRILKAILAAAIVLGFVGGAAAQSLGQLADKEKQKRQGKPAPKVITENDLEDSSNSTPAISDGEIVLRTFGHVWCVGK